MRIFKNTFLVVTTLLVSGCASTHLADQWKNPNYKTFKPTKVMVVGASQNLTARKLFEEKLVAEFKKRGINAIESTAIFGANFTQAPQTEEVINEQVEKLKQQGIDAVSITSAKGFDERSSYSGGYGRVDYRLSRFRGYYLMYQDIYFDPGYYEKYTVYHTESALYSLQNTKEDNLIWVASFDMVDPQKISSSVNKYIRILIKQLEREGLLPKN